MSERLGVSDRVSFRQSSMQNLKLSGNTKRVYFVCTDDDMGNLITAMPLACDDNAARIYVGTEHLVVIYPGALGSFFMGEPERRNGIRVKRIK